jgi:hypothetical protein
LATKIREAIFSTYGEVNLPLINSNAGPSEIINGKRNQRLGACQKSRN